MRMTAGAKTTLCGRHAQSAVACTKLSDRGANFANRVPKRRSNFKEFIAADAT